MRLPPHTRLVPRRAGAQGRPRPDIPGTREAGPAAGPPPGGFRMSVSSLTPIRVSSVSPDGSRPAVGQRTGPCEADAYVALRVRGTAGQPGSTDRKRDR